MIINWAFKNSSGTAIDLTDAIVLFTVKESNDVDEVDLTDSNALLEKEVTNIQYTEWTFTMTITPTDTIVIGVGSFSYDFKIKRSDQSEYSIQTGIINIDRVVTQR